MDYDDEVNTQTTGPLPKTLAELVNEWEDAKAAATDASFKLARATAAHNECAADVKAAYKAMNEAIDALRPKRPKKEKSS